MSPKRILNVYLSYLPKGTKLFLEILENKNLFQILGWTGCCTEGVYWEILALQVLKNHVLSRGFLPGGGG